MDWVKMWEEACVAKETKVLKFVCVAAMKLLGGMNGSSIGG